MKRRVGLLLVSLVMFFGLILTVSADNIALTGKGSIEITLQEGTDNRIQGAEITLYYIADAIEVNNNLTYLKRSELFDCDIVLDNLEDTNLVDEISKCNIDNTIKYVDITDMNGMVKYDNLDLGLYLVMQTNSVRGYSNFDSFLITIPKVEDNVWIYDIKAKPKSEIYKVVDVVVEKKWNSHNKDLPNEVTIELYDDELFVGSIKLNADNNWTYTFENLKLSDKYSVKEVNIPKGYTPSYKVNDYVFTVINTDILATTGQIFYPIIILLVVGIIFVLIGIKMIKEEV